MLPSVLMNLDFAATVGTPAAPTHEVSFSGIYILIGTGCWLAPLLAVLLLGVR